MNQIASGSHVNILQLIAMLQRRGPIPPGHIIGAMTPPVNKCRILLYAYLTALPRRNTHIHCSKFTISPVTYVEIGRNIAAGISQLTYAAAFPAAERVGRGTAAG